MTSIKHSIPPILILSMGLYAPKSPAKPAPKFEIYHESFYTTHAYKGINESAITRSGNLAPLFSGTEEELNVIFSKATLASKKVWAQDFLKLKFVLGERKILMDDKGVFQDGNQYKKLTREGFERLLILLFTEIPTPVRPTDWEHELDRRFPEHKS